MLSLLLTSGTLYSNNRSIAINYAFIVEPAAHFRTLEFNHCGQPSVGTTSFFLRHLPQTASRLSFHAVLPVFSTVLPTNGITHLPSISYSSKMPGASSSAIRHCQRIIFSTKEIFRNKFLSYPITIPNIFQQFLIYCFTAQRLSRKLCSHRSLWLFPSLLSVFQFASHCILLSLPTASLLAVNRFLAHAMSVFSA